MTGADPTNLAGRMAALPPSTSSPCTASRGRYPPDKTVLERHHAELLPGRQDRRARATTAPASRPCCGSWPGSTTSYRGEAQLAPGATVGLLEQEPHLDEAKDVRGQRRGRRRRAARPARPLQRARRELLRRDRRRVRAACRTQIDAADAWNLDTMLEHGDGRAAPAARRRRRDQALRRRAPPRRAVPPAAAARPTCCCSTSPPTTSTPSPSPGSSSTSTTTRARSSPSPTTATSSTTSPAGSSSSTAARGIPYEGNYSAWLEQKQSGWRRRSADKARASARSPPSSSGCARTPRAAARSPRRAWPATRRCWPRSATSSSTTSRSTSRPGPRLGDKVIEAEDLRKGFGDKLLIEDLSFSLPPGRDRRRDRRQRRRQDDAVPDDRRRRAARRRRARARRDGRARLRRPVARRARPGQDRLGGDLRAATTGSRSATGR